ncbi:hypothetical protein KGA66_06195 [Actinocrinis puniceicyclus]|uniref:Uncharacterized protein n=1 Tax=Actinocrinis puniceicyclus TaxID=977794 RepID=A0A8J7WKN9_9ACTN|nr:hypothetical protein [Actinocrinis puniceicyclus]MBS2962630.1 hypothetical protein [Actinocrinis puniceicyclus]
MSAQTLEFLSLSGTRPVFIKWMTYAAWPAAFLIFMLHVASVAFVSARVFDETEFWIVAVGCCGSPAVALRVLGRSLTPRACLLISALASGAAALFAALDLSAYISPTPSNRLIALALLLAMAVQALNAAETVSNGARLRSRHRAEITRLTAEWQQATARARVNHLESCTIHATQEVRRLAELIEAASGLSDAEARILERALARRDAPQTRDEPDPGLSRVVPFERVNGHYRT